MPKVKKLAERRQQMKTSKEEAPEITIGHFQGLIFGKKKLKNIFINDLSLKTSVYMKFAV